MTSYKEQLATAGTAIERTAIERAINTLYDKHDYIVACRTHGLDCKHFDAKSFTVDERGLIYENTMDIRISVMDRLNNCEAMIYRSRPAIDVWRPAK